ncbi:MAG TPA: phosphate-binding protein [Firmicutes bacterium]|nr:phosphate-binding protein [Bacillota bacterium]
MKRFLVLLVSVLALSLGIAGCGRRSGSLTVVGSTSVQPFMEMLAEKYQSENPDIQVNVQGGGSSAGVKSAIDGIADLGMASREIKDSELAEGITPIVIARDGIAVAVHPENAVSDLTIEEIRAIFAGEITSWEAIGGVGDIVVVMREEGSGTRGAFEEIVMNKVETTKDSIVQGSTGAVMSAIAGEPNAIGYISLANANATVKLLDVNGVETTNENILNGSYAIARPFSVCTKGDATGLAKDFIDFIMGEVGQQVLADEGLVVGK